MKQLAAQHAQWLCCGAVFLVTLDLSLIAVALPAISAHFSHLPAKDFAWLFIVYNVLMALCLLPAGWLADRFGRKRALLTGFVAFAMGCALCAISTSLTALLLGRAAQALGGAFMIPASLAIMLAPGGAARNRTVALWGAVAALAAALGPLIGGLLLQWFAWPAVFVATALFASTFALAAALCIPAQAMAGHRVRRFSLFDARVFALRSFQLSALATVFFVAGFSAWLVGAPLFLVQLWGYQGLSVGLAILPAPLLTVAVAPLAARLADQQGEGLVIFAGATLCMAALGCWLLALNMQVDYALRFLPGALLMGAGVGCGFPTLTAAALRDVPDDLIALATAGNTTARQFGMGLGASLAAGLAATDLELARQGWVWGLALFLGAALCAAALPLAYRLNQPQH